MRPWWKLLTGQGSMEQCGRVIVHTAVPLPFLLTPSHPLLLSAILNKQLNIAGETVHIHRVTIFPDMHAWCKCVKLDLFSWPSVCHRQGLHGKENAMGSQLQNSFAKCQQTSTVQFYRWGTLWVGSAELKQTIQPFQKTRLFWFLLES